MKLEGEMGEFEKNSEGNENDRGTKKETANKV